MRFWANTLLLRIVWGKLDSPATIVVAGFFINACGFLLLFTEFTTIIIRAVRKDGFYLQKGNNQRSSIGTYATFFAVA